MDNRVYQLEQEKLKIEAKAIAIDSLTKIIITLIVAVTVVTCLMLHINS